MICDAWAAPAVVRRLSCNRHGAVAHPCKNACFQVPKPCPTCKMEVGDFLSGAAVNREMQQVGQGACQARLTLRRAFSSCQPPCVCADTSWVEAWRTASAHKSISLLALDFGPSPAALHTHTYTHTHHPCHVKAPLHTHN
jgi:hypothetical protein